MSVCLSVCLSIERIQIMNTELNTSNQLVFLNVANVRHVNKAYLIEKRRNGKVDLQTNPFVNADDEKTF